MPGPGGAAARLGRVAPVHVVSCCVHVHVHKLAQLLLQSVLEESGDTHCLSSVANNGGREQMWSSEQSAVLQLHAARFYACWLSWTACRSPARGAMCCRARKTMDGQAVYCKLSSMAQSQPGTASFTNRNSHVMCRAACHRPGAWGGSQTPSNTHEPGCHPALRHGSTSSTDAAAGCRCFLRTCV
jgi:hypothetical protein